MRSKRLLIFSTGLVLLVGAYFIYQGYATPLPNDTLRQVKTVSIQDDWEGYSAFSPCKTHVVFTPENGVWSGVVSLSIEYTKKVNGKWKQLTSTETAASRVPNAVMQKVFHALQGIPLRHGSYQPSITHTDDHPLPTLAFQTPTQIVTFHSESNTPDRTPWQVKMTGGSFVTHSDAPNEALLLLRPYLHQREFDKLITQAKGPVKNL